MFRKHSFDVRPQSPHALMHRLIFLVLAAFFGADAARLGATTLPCRGAEEELACPLGLLCAFEAAATRATRTDAAGKAWPLAEEPLRGLPKTMPRRYY
jgi:hypothetical protein